MPRVLVFGQLCYPAQDNKITFAEACHQLLAWFASFAVRVLWERAHLFTGLPALKVVLIASTPTIDEGLALFRQAVVGPSGLIGFAVPLEGWQVADVDGAVHAR